MNCETGGLRGDPRSNVFWGIDERFFWERVKHLVFDVMHKPFKTRNRPENAVGFIELNRSIPATLGGNRPQSRSMQSPSGAPGSHKHFEAISNPRGVAACRPASAASRYALSTSASGRRVS